MIKMLVCDFDGTISGGEPELVSDFRRFVEQQHGLKFVVATGRTLPSIRSGLSGAPYPLPSTIISDVGTQMHHGVSLGPDRHWHQCVNQKWDKQSLTAILDEVAYLGNINEQHQGEYKLTFEGRLSPSQLKELNSLIAENQVSVDLTYSHDWFLDLTPKGINKATALTHLMDSYDVKPCEVVVAGDSANDTAMLTMPGVNGVLVANHYPEVTHLGQLPQVYIASDKHAAGVIEGFHYWNKAQ